MGASVGQLAKDFVGGSQGPNLKVTSSEFQSLKRIPVRFSDYGHKVSPPLSWSAGPEGTKSYAVVVDDPDAKPTLVNHWVIFNIPADMTALSEGVPLVPSLDMPKGVRQGANTIGSVGYFGPRPPAGDQSHRYHFQVFALDKSLDVDPGADRAAVLDAMKGHVLATGELIGTFRRPQDLDAAVKSASDNAQK